MGGVRGCGCVCLGVCMWGVGGCVCVCVYDAFVDADE